MQFIGVTKREIYATSAATAVAINIAPRLIRVVSSCLEKNASLCG